MPTQSTDLALDSFVYRKGSGWSVESFPALDSDKTLVLVFASPSYFDDPAPIAQLCKAYPSACMVGCSTAGEIAGDSLIDESLSVAVARFGHTRLASASAPVRTAADSFKAGDVIARQLDGPDLRGILVLSDGLNVNGSELVRGIMSVVDDSVIVTGGLAGDGTDFKRTWVLRDRKPAQGFVSAVGLYGKRVHIGYGSKGGWDAFGPERKVTRSEANVLYELDGRPALPLYKEYLGDRASGLPATALLFPLSLRKDAGDQTRLVRTVLSVDESSQSMVFAGDVPSGYLAQLMCANFDRLIEGAADSALMTRASDEVAPCLAIAISCVGRRLVLRDRAEEELESTLAVFPSGSRQVGFYSYGELSPTGFGRCDLHNQTMTLTTIVER